MFIKPQIASTPHFVAPMGDMIGQACQGGFGTSCPITFSCSPYNSNGCVDATYNPGSVSVFFVAPVVIGPIILR